jgi:hypothetical protein
MQELLDEAHDHNDRRAWSRPSRTKELFPRPLSPMISQKRLVGDMKNPDGTKR